MVSYWFVGLAKDVIMGDAVCILLSREQLIKDARCRKMGDARCRKRDGLGKGGAW